MTFGTICIQVDDVVMEVLRKKTSDENDELEMQVKTAEEDLKQRQEADAAQQKKEEEKRKKEELVSSYSKLYSNPYQDLRFVAKKTGRKLEKTGTGKKDWRCTAGRKENAAAAGQRCNW